MNTEFRASYTGEPGAWIGAIRQGRKVLWTCSHTHTNRDHSTFTNGRSASKCAHLALQAAMLQPEEIDARERDAMQYFNHCAMRPGMASDAADTKSQFAYQRAIRAKVREALGLPEINQGGSDQ